MIITNNNFGYIYVRRNDYYNMFNLCKLGKTLNIPNRDSTYVTSEIIRGYFYPVYQVDINFLDQIEKELQTEFINYHYYRGGGTEFYNIEIINLIELFLKNKNYNYYILTQEEIDNLIRSNNNIKPYDFQQDEINKAVSLFLLSYKYGK